jgi:hypothetical protein
LFDLVVGSYAAIMSNRFTRWLCSACQSFTYRHRGRPVQCIARCVCTSAPLETNTTCQGKIAIMALTNLRESLGRML